LAEERKLGLWVRRIMALPGKSNIAWFSCRIDNLWVKRGFFLWGIYRKGARFFVGEKETKKFCGRKIAYTGHFCPSTGTDKSGKLGYFPSTGMESNIFQYIKHSVNKW